MSSVVALVGLPGGGKSTVGRQLARRLGARFLDADAVLEERIGMPIRSYLEQHGEAPFRDLEAQVIDELTSPGQGPLILATGGGAVLRAENRQRLHERTTVIYLRSTAEELFKRLRHDTQRPLLQVADPLAKLRELHAQRHPLYEEVAHYRVDTGRPSVATLVNMILMQLDLAGLVPALSQPNEDQAASPLPPAPSSPT